MIDQNSDRGSLRMTRELELTTTYPSTTRLHVARHEWQRLRRCIANLPKRRSLFRDLAFACLGIAIPSFLTAITLPLQSPNAPNWVHIVYWSVAASTFSSFVLCLVLQKQVEDDVSAEVADVLEEMGDIERHSAQSQERPASPPLERPASQHGSETIFSDAFEDFVGWDRFENGVVIHSTDVARSHGHSLKKDQHNDPNGGCKEIGVALECGFVFSGWIFNPADRAGGGADRLALEDKDFNGYGFAVEHPAQRVYFEKRTNGRQNRISDITECNQLPTDDWYGFRFHVLEDKVLRVRLFNSTGDEIHEISTHTQGEYDMFDRVVVHGGYQYYLDNLSIDLLANE